MQRSTLSLLPSFPSLLCSSSPRVARASNAAAGARRTSNVDSNRGTKRIRIKPFSTRSRRGRSCWWRRRRSSPYRNARPRGSGHRTVDKKGKGIEGQRGLLTRRRESTEAGKKSFVIFRRQARFAGSDRPMTHLIDGDDLAVIVEPVGLGAKDLHLRWGWREVGRIGGQHSIRLGSILDLCHLVLVIARGRRRRRMDRSPDAGLSRARVVDARHGRGPRRREVNAPSVVSPFPFGREGKFGSLTLEPRGGPMGGGFASSAGLAASPSSCWS